MLAHPLFEGSALVLKVRVEYLVRVDEDLLLGLNSLKEHLSLLNKELILLENGLVVDDMLELIGVEVGDGNELEDLFGVSSGLKHILNSIDHLDGVLHVGFFESLEDAVGF